MTLARKSELTKLYRRIQTVTKAYGKKKELAGFLGVSSQQLNNWLSKFNEPGGEITLQMLQWVEVEEAKQNKNPERVSPRPGRKTQKPKSVYEKRKPSPRKK